MFIRVRLGFGKGLYVSFIPVGGVLVGARQRQLQRRQRRQQRQQRRQQRQQRRQRQQRQRRRRQLIIAVR